METNRANKVIKWGKPIKGKKTEILRARPMHDTWRLLGAPLGALPGLKMTSAEASKGCPLGSCSSIVKGVLDHPHYRAIGRLSVT